MKKIMRSILLIIFSASLVAPFLGAKICNREENLLVNETETSEESIVTAGVECDINDILTTEQEPLIVEYNNIERETSPETNQKYGWTTTRVNVRKSPSTSSDVLDVYEFNTEVQYVDCGDWCEIKYEDSVAYIYKQYITDEIIDYELFRVPSNRGFKSFMPYTAITSKESSQYKLQDEYAYTGTYGIRQVNERFCVAVGTAFEMSVGTYFDLVLENGTIVPCIVGDIKADQHTQSNNIITSSNGCLSEFIIDKSEFVAYSFGDVSYCDDSWKSPVRYFRVYETNVLD